MLYAKAFSLLELLVVLGIVAILTGIAVPAYNNYFIKAQVIELLTVADSYKLKLIENLYTAASPKNSVYNLDSRLIQQVIISTNAQRPEKHIVQVVAKMKTATHDGIGLLQPDSASGPLMIQLQGTATGDMLEWTCHAASEYQAYVPSRCHNNQLEDVRIT